MARCIRRDSFARVELIRELEYLSSPHTCAWCGAVRHTGTGRAYLYRYAVQTDGGRVHADQRLFCGLGCRTCYGE